MKAEERNELIKACVAEYQACHDKYFPTKGSLTDEQWKDCIDEFDAIADKYKKNPILIHNISGAICMAYLNDLEEYHKKWVVHENGNKV